jgi:membrane protein DedA with SNARE-associated domain
MHHSTFNLVRGFVANYGYWAVAIALLGESAGIPVPGEITLLLASFLAYSERHLHFGWIIVVATGAATLGGQLGYAAGYYGGRPLLDRYQSVLRISSATMKRGEDMFERHGAVAIFLSRWLFGMRTFAGPLAGVLRMRWRAFALFNFLGAAVWVTCIASAGHLFGRHWHTLLRTMQRFNIAVLIVAVAALLYLWRRHRHKPPAEK